MLTREKNIVIVERDDSMQPEEEGKRKTRRGRLVIEVSGLDDRQRWTAE